MINLKAQRGASYWGIMVGVLLAIVAVKAALIIWPAYWDNRLINASIEERLKTSTSSEPAQFMQDLEQQFNLNNLRDVQASDIMTVSNSGGALVVQVDYEVRKNFMGNVDLVVAFEKQFDQRALKVTGQ